MKFLFKGPFLSPFLFFSCFTSQADIDPDPNPGYHPEIIPPAPTVASWAKLTFLI